MNLFSKLSTWYFSRKTLPYWSIILLDCLVILFSGLLVYALNNGIFATKGIFWHLSLTWGVCLVPYLVGFRLFRTYSGIIRYSSFVDLQRVGFAVLFGAVCVVAFQELTDFSPYLVYIRKRDLVLSSLLAMSLMWAMRVFVKYFYVTTFHPKIKIAKVREYDYDTVCQDIDELVGLGRSKDDMAIVGKMKAEQKKYVR